VASGRGMKCINLQFNTPIDIEEFLSYTPFHRNIFIQRLVYIDIDAKADDCLNILMDNYSNSEIDYG
jgi:hypothetical protein